MPVTKVIDVQNSRLGYSTHDHDSRKHSPYKGMSMPTVHRKGTNISIARRKSNKSNNIHAMIGIIVKISPTLNQSGHFFLTNCSLFCEGTPIETKDQINNKE